MADLNEKIAEGNKLIADGKAITADFLAGFDKLNKEYAEFKAREVYAELGKKEKPMIAAITEYSYTVKRHAEVRDKDTRKITEFKLTDKTRQIDLLKFAKQNKLADDWQHKGMAVNQSFCLRAARELGFSKAEIANVAKSYHMSKEAQAMADGKAPVSNNQLCKKLQGFIDAILPPEDEEKGNIYKCNNHDVAYVLMCYTRKGRNALSIATAKDRQLRNLVMDVMHRIITDKKYTLEYKQVKDDKSSAKADKSKNSKPDVSKIPTEELSAELDKRYDDLVDDLKAMDSVA